MRKALGWIALVYLCATIAGILVGYLIRRQHPLFVALTADLTATVVVFVFSYLLRNSSVYDAYWSIAPVAIALYWAAADRLARASGIRPIFVLTLVGIWAIRLTWNWLRRWGGLEDEDWRYVDLRARHGHTYWLVSFLGIHLMPTVLVFLGCLSLFPALTDGTRPLGILDLAAIFVTGGAIWIEAQADRELWRFRTTAHPPDKILNTGIWQFSRHPNYLGEIAFWWGLYFFCLAAAPLYWWTIVGPLSITVLFLSISIPMIERRMLERRPKYAVQIENTPRLLPWFPKSTGHKTNE